MAKYSYITDKTHNNRKIQVESAKRDGSGKNIENNYAKQNGNYQSLTAGLSNNFDTKKVMVDESAYNFRPTATMGSVELEVGSPCKVKKIIGGTIVFNQLVTPLTDQSWYQGGMNKAVNDGVATLTATTQYGSTQQNIDLISGHKYILRFDIRLTTPNANIIVGLGDNGYVALEGVSFRGSTISNTEWNSVAILGNYTTLGSTKKIVVLDGRAENWDNIYIKNINVIDLTQMFGSTIADYIYSLEQANAGSGVAWFKRYFPKEYYAYNSGELVSVKTQGKKITHFNQWDEEWELGAIDLANGQDISSSTYFRSKNYTNIIPSTLYYSKSASAIYGCFYDANKGFISAFSNDNTPFETPSNAYYVRFYTQGTTYNHDICINFHYDGERDGEYEPYNSETYPCDDVELRGIPQLDENNNLAFDGDEYANDGSVKRKYGIVDLGTLTWTYNATYGVMSCQIPYKTTSTGAPMLISSKGNLVSSSTALSSMNNNDFRAYYFNYPNDIVWKTDETDPTTFKNSLSGVYLVYELATPTDENSIPFTEVQECDNWGTEEWLSPTTDTRPCEVPVGHETDYLPDLKAKLEVAPNTPNENGVYVMEHNASGNSYTPIATWLTDNGYVKSTDVANGYGTKDALGGTLKNLLAVKDSVDFDNLFYVDLGDLSWSYNGTFMYAPLTIAPKVDSNAFLTSKMCTAFKLVDSSVETTQHAVQYYSDLLRIKDNNYSSETEFKNAMKGILLAYEKAS